MKNEEERKRVCDVIMLIESEFNAGTIKQLVCVLISRLLNPMAVEETAGMMLAFSQAEELETTEKIIH